MSRMFAKGHRFFSVPQSLIHVVSELSAKQLWLLLWLHSEAQRRSSNELRYTNKEVADALQAHHTNVGEMRSALINAGLLLDQKRDHGKFTYTLLDPGTGVPIDEPAVAEDEGNWNELPTVAPGAAEVSAAPASEPVHDEEPATLTSLVDMSAEDLKKRYESLSDRSPEEVDISAQIRLYRNDVNRTAELKEKRAALEVLRRQEKDCIRQELETRGEVRAPGECEVGL